MCIGAAEGHNWWCVIFPPMCLPAAEEPQELADVLDAQQLQIVEGQNRYVIKFKALEYYEQDQSVAGWFGESHMHEKELGDGFLFLYFELFVAGNTV